MFLNFHNLFVKIYTLRLWYFISPCTDSINLVVVGIYKIRVFDFGFFHCSKRCYDNWEIAILLYSWWPLLGKLIPSWKYAACQSKVSLKKFQTAEKKKICHKGTCPLSHGDNKDRSNIVKTHQKWFFFIFNNTFTYTWVDFTCFKKYLIFLKSPWWLAWTFCVQTPITF